MYVIFNIYDNVVSSYNFSLYATIRVYGRFGPGLGQFLGPPLSVSHVMSRTILNMKALGSNIYTDTDRDRVEQRLYMR